MRRGLHERLTESSVAHALTGLESLPVLQLRAPLALALAAREVGDRARGCKDGTIASSSIYMSAYNGEMYFQR